MVTRLVDGGGSVSFAGAAYKAGRALARRSVEVGVIDGQVVIRADGQTVRTHVIRHDRDKEHGALANPNGRPRKGGARMLVGTGPRTRPGTRSPRRGQRVFNPLRWLLRVDEPRFVPSGCPGGASSQSP